MRKFIFVTRCDGRIPIYAASRDEANDEYERRGYSFSDLIEVR